MNAVVVIPTYNEAGHIESLISQILNFQPKINILIVDDNSPDGTGRIVDGLSKKSDRIKILHRPKKLGFGKAYLEGLCYALSQSPPYDKVIQMDADFSHHPKYLNALLEATEDKDIAIGSRYIAGGRIPDWELCRRALSRLANIYVYFWLRLKVKDCTGGFRCFRREVLDKIGLTTIKSNGYFFQIEVLERCLRLGCSFKEVPITFTERKEGKTKLRLSDIWEAFCGVLLLHFG
ncbi:MAG: polyprenol monophosphomannose synthase [Candidatus Omnitrophica bacterium]|nr:polyprenol monophosphomannose synthase [Candidatus Omnitrophota bacterium]